MVDSYTGPMRSSAPSGSATQYNDPKQIDNILKSSDPGRRSRRRGGRTRSSPRRTRRSRASCCPCATTCTTPGAARTPPPRSHNCARCGPPPPRSTRPRTRSEWRSSVTAPNILAWYKNSKPPSTSLADARRWMAGANERISQSWSSLPVGPVHHASTGLFQVRTRPHERQLADRHGRFDRRGFGRRRPRRRPYPGADRPCAGRPLGHRWNGSGTRGAPAAPEAVPEPASVGLPAAPASVGTPAVFAGRRLRGRLWSSRLPAVAF